MMLSIFVSKVVIEWEYQPHRALLKKMFFLVALCMADCGIDVNGWDDTLNISFFKKESVPRVK